MLGSGTQGVWEISGRGGATAEWLDRMEVKEERGEKRSKKERLIWPARR